MDTIFYDAVAPNALMNTKLSGALGVGPNTIDLAGTVIGGALRVMTVVFTILVLFSPGVSNSAI